MFTGLVEGMGRIVRLESETAGLRIVVAPPAEMCSGRDPVRLGESIAINGCCLTVIGLDAGEWSFQAGTETLSKTNLGRLVLDDAANLERSLPAEGRLGGHFVQGHVDGVGTVHQVDRQADWVTMRFRAPHALVELMVPKGSIAIDGVSLTLVDVDRDSFSVALIPHTLAVTTLGRRKASDTVNLETDILGKYIKKFLATLCSESK